MRSQLALKNFTFYITFLTFLGKFPANSQKNRGDRQILEGDRLPPQPLILQGFQRFLKSRLKDH
jgi:hypothetical protein